MSMQYYLQMAFSFLYTYACSSGVSQYVTTMSFMPGFHNCLTFSMTIDGFPTIRALSTTPVPANTSA